MLVACQPGDDGIVDYGPSPTIDIPTGPPPTVYPMPFTSDSNRIFGSAEITVPAFGRDGCPHGPMTLHNDVWRSPATGRYVVLAESFEDFTDGLAGVDGVAHVQCLDRDGITVLDERVVLLSKSGTARYTVAARLPAPPAGWRIGIIYNTDPIAIGIYHVSGTVRRVELRIYRWDGHTLRPVPTTEKAYIRDGEMLLTVRATPLTLRRDADGMLSGQLTLSIGNRGDMTSTDAVVRVTAPVPIAVDSNGMYAHPGDWRSFGPDGEGMYAAVARISPPAPGDLSQATLNVHIPDTGRPVQATATIQLTSIDYGTPMISVSDGPDRTRFTIDY
jgi:hypothetical protein